MKARQVPVLVTWDVDPNDYFDPAQKHTSMQAALDLCADLGIRATFFFVAREAAEYHDEINAIQRSGHEVGCHGLTHGAEEEYQRLPEAMQRRFLDEATRILENLSGIRITAFRGPRVKVSATTLRVLGEFGYLTDSSVCSQRLDLVSANPINVGWLIAPRVPYHPHRDNVFRRGDLPVLEVPIAAAGLPLISTSLYVLRLGVMKTLLRLLHAEARATGKPIVYLAHPEEFGPQSFPFKLSELSLASLRAHGLMLRKRLNERDPASRLRLNRALLSFCASLPGVHFVTMRDVALGASGAPAM